MLNEINFFIILIIVVIVTFLGRKYLGYKLGKKWEALFIAVILVIVAILMFALM